MGWWCYLASRQEETCNKTSFEFCALYCALYCELYCALYCALYSLVEEAGGRRAGLPGGELCELGGGGAQLAADATLHPPEVTLILALGGARGAAGALLTQILAKARNQANREDEAKEEQIIPVRSLFLYWCNSPEKVNLPKKLPNYISSTYVSVDWTAAAVAVVAAVVVVVALDVGGKVDRVATVTSSGFLGSSILPTISSLVVCTPS